MRQYKISIPKDQSITKNSELTVEAVMKQFYFCKENYFKIPRAKDNKRVRESLKKTLEPKISNICLYVLICCLHYSPKVTRIRFLRTED